MKNLIYLFLIVSFTSVHAQKSLEYYGIAKLNDTTALTYRVVFEEHNGKVKGYSLTDFGGEHETKSNVVGTYDDVNKQLSFRESGIVYTKSIFVKNDFCFIHLKPVKFKLGKTKSFNGDFEGKFKDGSKCIDGQLILHAVERIEKYVNKFTKKVNKSKRVDEELKEKFNNVSIMDSLKLNVLKHEEVTSFFSKSKSVKVLLYDSAKIDGDITSIYVDGKVTLKSHRSTDKVMELIIPLNSEVTEIKFVSESIGTMGLNTTAVELIDDTNTIKAFTNLKKGEITTVNVIKLE